MGDSGLATWVDKTSKGQTPERAKGSKVTSTYGMASATAMAATKEAQAVNSVATHAEAAALHTRAAKMGGEQGKGHVEMAANHLASAKSAPDRLPSMKGKSLAKAEKDPSYGEAASSAYRAGDQAKKSGSYLDHVEAASLHDRAANLADKVGMSGMVKSHEILRDNHLKSASNADDRPRDEHGRFTSA
jgi:hypothetical protein